MAVDKLVDSTQLDADLTSVANAIRTKGGTSAQLAFPAGFVDAIDAISGGSGIQYSSGIYTPSSDISANVTITNIGVIGFTPRIFILEVLQRASVSNKIAFLFSVFNGLGDGYKTTCRYANTSNVVGGAFSAKSWTTSEGMFLYKSGNNIIFRANTSYPLFSGVDYIWHAFN